MVHPSTAGPDGGTRTWLLTTHSTLSSNTTLSTGMPSITTPEHADNIGGVANGVSDVDGIELASEAIARGEWVQRPDPNTGRPYYIQCASGLAVWDLASELLKGRRQTLNATVREAIFTKEWRTALDQTSRSLYYFHPATGHTAWELTEADILEAREALISQQQPPGGEPPKAPLGEASGEPSGEPSGEQSGEQSGEPPGDDEEKALLAQIDEEEEEEEEEEEHPPVFDESLPGSVRAQEMLDAGLWTWGRDKKGFLFFTQVASGRTVRDLRAEMAQNMAEERQEVLLDEHARDELPPSPARKDDTNNETDSPPPPPPPEDEDEAEEQHEEPPPEMPLNDPAWDPPPPAESEPPPAPDLSVREVAVAVPDFDTMFTSVSGDDGSDATLREMSLDMQALQDGVERVSQVKPVSRRKGVYDAHSKWGSVQYMDSSNEASIAVAVKQTELHAQTKEDLGKLEAEYQTTIELVRPMAPKKVPQVLPPVAPPQDWVSAPAALSISPPYLLRGVREPYGPDARPAMRLKRHSDQRYEMLPGGPMLDRLVV